MKLRNSSNIILRSLAATLFFASVALSITLSPLAYADKADVVDATISSLGDGRYRIDATVAHADTGWDHYADAWEVTTPEGEILGVRVLAHPHVNEQPFTRSLTLEIPAGVTMVILQANDSVHGGGGARFELQVPDAAS